MFADQCEVSGISRLTCRIPDRFPTNPQAEVLVFSRVPMAYITAAYFQDLAGMSKYAPAKEGVSLTVGVESEYFKPRCDWRVWKHVSEPSAGDLWQDAQSSDHF
jgi:hypothetical protein